MIHILGEMRDLNTGDYGCELEDYSGYICDAIMEISDYNVDIYNANLWDWAKHNEDWCEEAIFEFGSEIVKNGLTHVFQCGQYLQISNELYQNLDDCIKWVAYNYYFRNFGEEMEEDKFDELNDALADIDSNDYVSDITDIVDGLFNEEDEDQ